MQTSQLPFRKVKWIKVYLTIHLSLSSMSTTITHPRRKEVLIHFGELLLITFSDNFLS